MSIIIRHIWRNIKSNRFRSVLIVFSLALAAAVFYLNLNIKSDVCASSVTILDGATKGYDVMVSGDVENTELPETEKEFSYRSSPAVMGDDAVILMQMDLSQVVDEGLITLETDVDTSALRTEGAAVMSRTKALYFKLNVGDTFTVTQDGKETTYHLVAYASSLKMFAGGDAKRHEILAFSDDFTPNFMLISLSDNSSLESAVTDIGNSAENVTATALYDSSGANDQLQSIQQVLSVILLLVIAIAFYVVSSTGSLIINYRIPVLGTFRSIGATARTTNFLLVAENVVYGLVAGIPGMFFGELLRRIIQTWYLGSENTVINLWYFLSIPLFTVAMNVVISLFSILKMGRKPIRELIFRKQSSASKPSLIVGVIGLLMLGGSFVIAAVNTRYQFMPLVAELLLALIGSGLALGVICRFVSHFFSKPMLKQNHGPAWLGIRNLSVSRINRSTTLLVMTVLSLVLMIYSSVGSITEFFGEYQNNFPYEIMIKSACGTEDSFTYIEEVDGIDSITYEYWKYDSAMINGEEKRVCFCANDGFSNGIRVDDDLLDSMQDGETVIDRMFATVNGYEIGDKLTVSVIGYEDGETVSLPSFSLKVVGLCDSAIFNASRITLLMTRQDYYQYITDSPSVIGIFTDRPVDDLMADLNDAIAINTGTTFHVMNKADYISEDIVDAMNALKAVSVIPILTIALALCGLVNNQLIAFNQKRTSFAVLYSTVMSRKQLGKMMFSELLSSFSVGCICGLLLCVWLSKIMRDIIFSSLVYMPLVISPKQILPSIGLLFVLLCVTAAFPLSQLRKLDIVKEIKYE